MMLLCYNLHFWGSSWFFFFFLKKKGKEKKRGKGGGGGCRKERTKREREREIGDSASYNKLHRLCASLSLLSARNHSTDNSPSFSFLFFSFLLLTSHDTYICVRALLAECVHKWWGAKL